MAAEGKNEAVVDSGPEPPVDPNRVDLKKWNAVGRFNSGH